MSDRPIIFSAPMVRALLAGRKTQTRRLAWRWVKHRAERHLGNDDADGSHQPTPWRSVRPGDRLWVREAWRVAAWREDGHMAADYHASPEDVRTPWLPVPDSAWDALWHQSSEDARKAGEAGIGSTRRDGDGWKWRRGDSPCRWRSSIHMPRWASRITLHVEAVRVERLQDISEENAQAEGMMPEGPGFSLDGESTFYAPTARGTFWSLWDYLHGSGAWQRNPEVVAITFRVVRGNIDREARDD